MTRRGAEVLNMGGTCDASGFALENRAAAGRVATPDCPPWGPTRQPTAGAGPARSTAARRAPLGRLARRVYTTAAGRRRPQSGCSSTQLCYHLTISRYYLGFDSLFRIRAQHTSRWPSGDVPGGARYGTKIGSAIGRKSQFTAGVDGEMHFLLIILQHLLGRIPRREMAQQPEPIPHPGSQTEPAARCTRQGTTPRVGWLSHRSVRSRGPVRSGADRRASSGRLEAQWRPGDQCPPCPPCEGSGGCSDAVG
jgi:hypothetical protein